MDIDKAFEVETGILIEDGPFYTGGASSPIGLDLPVNTLYVQNVGDRVVIWQKYDTLVTDWRVFPAQDIGFDPTGLETSATDVQEAIAEQVERAYGKDFAVATRDTTLRASSTSFTEYLSLNFTVTAPALNQYRLNSYFVWGHSSTSNDGRARVLVDGNNVGEIRIEPKDTGNNQRIPDNILSYLDDLSPGDHTVSLQLRPSNNGNTTSFYKGIIELWRVK